MKIYSNKKRSNNNHQTIRPFTPIMKKLLLSFTGLLISTAPLTSISSELLPAYLDASLTPEQRVADLLPRMTLEEKEDMVRFILEIRARGTTVVLIEHDLGVVMDISDRVYVLDFGQVIAEGRPEEVARNPRVQEAYMGVEV